VDATSVLRADHDHMLGIFAELAQGRTVLAGATEAELLARKHLVSKLVAIVSAHEAVEEQYLWPLVRHQVPGGEKLATHAIEQETAAKRTLAQLDHLPSHDPVFESLLAQFTARAREHLDYEQRHVWPRLQAAVPAPVLEKTGRQILEAKATAPTRPHPHTPPTPGMLRTVGAAEAMLDRLRDAATGRRKGPE
jgi:hypothetical protein